MSDPTTPDVRLRLAAEAIFAKREGAYGTALIDRGATELAEDLENLRDALTGGERVLVDVVIQPGQTHTPEVGISCSNRTDKPLRVIVVATESA